MDKSSEGLFTACKVDAVCDFKDVPTSQMKPSECKGPIQVGVFFDGTDNNRERDKPRFAHSNIARLFDTYPDLQPAGFYRTYIPGVGTAFPEIGEKGEGTRGNAFGIGCEVRILYAIINLLNVVHSHSLNGKPMFTRDELKTLCKTPGFFGGEDSQKAVHDSGGGIRFFSAKAEDLRQKIDISESQRISECVLDVFGFSRGAAQARVFCTWISQIAKNKRIAGIPLRIRFLGIFDTVASAGFWHSVGKDLNGRTDGHSSWALPEFLRVPSIVENCAHFIAMHELRKNFPLDEIGQNGLLPKGYVQLAYPGAHSDVGGGYGPGDLGISVGPMSAAGDSLKLSQIPLNHMLESARAAGVPMSKENSRNYKISDQFDVSPKVKEAVGTFLRESGTKIRSLREWMQPFLNWRWQVREAYASTMHVMSANAEDKRFLLLCNAKLVEDAKLLQAFGNTKRAKSYAANVVSGGVLAESGKHYRSNESSILHLDLEAPAILAAAMNAPQVSPKLAAFFDGFVHDSYAGFSRDLKEPTGYWRYRKIFRGDAKPIF